MMDDYLRGLSPFDPNGSLSQADADRIWASYKAAGGGRDVSASLPIGGGLPSGDGGKFTGVPKMDFSGFGSMAGMMPRGGLPNGGILGGIQRLTTPSPAAAPQVPADGDMQPTIGPGGAAPAAAAPAPIKAGLPQGGILGLLQGQSPQGLMGLLKRVLPGQQAAPLAGAMPQAGLLPGVPGSPIQGPIAPPSPQLPTNINPMDQF